MLRLHAGDACAEVAPEVGGSVAAFYRVPGAGRPRRDWLRAADAASLAAREPRGMASFPLVPWCNRIRDGRFEWRGRRVQLPPHDARSPHPLHGVGWRRPWRVLRQTPAAVDLALAVDAGDADWPFPFDARQRIALDDDGALTLSIVLANRGDAPMPAALGHHPYFAKSEGVQVRAQVDAAWTIDADVLPVALDASHPAVAALRDGLPVDRFDLDHNFTGFDGSADVRWRDGARLALRATGLDALVLYCPPAHDFFCVEPVGNCTDWLNLRHRHPPRDVGGHTLPPGATLHASVRFAPHAAP